MGARPTARCVRIMRGSRSLVLAFLSAVIAQGPAATALGQSVEEGIPIDDALVKTKCARCHTSDQRGNMQRISWTRTTPEGWQDVLKQMILVNGLTVTPPEARAIVKYLSARHGLSPEEARRVMYYPERRIHDESDLASEAVRNACGKCHALASPLSWRRSASDWQAFLESHSIEYKFPRNDETIAFLAKAAPLRSSEWGDWRGGDGSAKLTGRWLVTASVSGHGKYYGEMEAKDGADDTIDTQVTLRSVNDGSTIVRSGRGAVFGGYAWRGRSKGTGSALASASPGSPAPDDPASDAREVLSFARDQMSAEGRWFWGQYQEFGFDVKLRRASTGATLLGVDRTSLKTGSKANRLRLIGDNFPERIRRRDVSVGPGVTVRRVISHTASEIVVEADVTAGAPLGKRTVAVRGSLLPDALAVYDVVDYIKITPESALAAFGDTKQARGNLSGAIQAAYQRGYQQFEAIGYYRGADGKRRTGDDVELGPVDVSWSMEVFYATKGSQTDQVGAVSSTGFFTPAADSAKNNFDVWVIATAKDEKDAQDKPLVGKAYLVVTVPWYAFNGRRYVRNLDRWVDDGPVAGAR